MNNIRLGILVLALLSGLYGCGFQLRGEQPLPANIEQVWLQSQVIDGPLYRALKRRLKEYQINTLTGAEPVNEPKTVAIVLAGDSLKRRLLSLYPTGQVAEYELILQINYQLIFPDSEPQDVSFVISRDYQDDPDEVLAKSRELDLVLSEMRRRAAERIIRLLPSQASNP